jgi:hypothetical protein
VFFIYGLFFRDPAEATGVWLGFLLIQILSAAYALRLDGEPMAELWVLPLQLFVYRQLLYLVIIQSVVTALLGNRLSWQRMRRDGTAGEHLLTEPIQEKSLSSAK